jgi:hypothetical protein
MHHVLTFSMLTNRLPRRPGAAARLLCGILLGSTLLLTGCDLVGTTTDPAQEVVVESYQVAGEPLAPVRLSRSAPLDSTYDFEAYAITGADVSVALLDEEGETVEERYPYRAVPDSNGLYAPQGVAVPSVQPLRTYRLRVRLPESDETVTATTTVPGAFEVVDASRDTAAYQQEQIALTVTPSRYPGRDQSYYIFTTEALDVRREQLTPLIRRLIDDGQGDVRLEDLRITSSPIINEESYERNEDGTITIQLPWIAVAFFGPNRTRANAIDNNLYDYIRSQNAQGGGGGTPGTIPNVIDRVEGGTGVFGSMAQQAYRIYVARPESTDASSTDAGSTDAGRIGAGRTGAGR